MVEKQCTMYGSFVECLIVCGSEALWYFVSRLELFVNL